MRFIKYLIPIFIAVNAHAVNKVELLDPSAIVIANYKKTSLTCHRDLLIHGKRKLIDGLEYFISDNKRLKKKLKKLRKQNNTVKIKKQRKIFKKKRKACRAAIANNPIVIPTELLEPYTGTYGLAEAKHLYRRAGFSASNQTIIDSVNKGIEDTLRDLFRQIDTPSLDAEYQEQITYTDDDTGKSEVVTWQMDQGQLLRFLKDPNQLREKMFYFWHDRFTAAERASGGNEDMLSDYIDILYTEGLHGNLRDLAKRMTVNGVMLEWLDGKSNYVGHINENYAREFWELFTLGHDQYTEKDVNEAARCLTGWTWLWDEQTETNYVAFVDEDFDNDSKVVFEGTSYERIGNFDVFHLVDMTLDSHPAAARYMAKNLLEFFIEKDPNQIVVENLAQYIREVNYEIAPVVRRIISSKYFFLSNTRKNSIKTPLEFSIGFMRDLGLDHFRGWGVNNSISQQGLRILNPPSVKGWDDDEYWLNDQWMLNRINFTYEILHSADWEDADFNYRKLMPKNKSTAEQFLNYALQRLDLTIDASLRAEFLKYIQTGSWEVGDEYEINFVEASDTEVQRKVIGVYYLLTHLEEYQLM